MIDRWFIHNIKELIDLELDMKKYYNCKSISDFPVELLKKAKEYGFSDRQLGKFLNKDELRIRKYRLSKGIGAVYKVVDTCGAEFEAYTPYYYSTYEK
jgi:carbamoyl-phosphate synthase large subunit